MEGFKRLALVAAAFIWFMVARGIIALFFMGCPSYWGHRDYGTCDRLEWWWAWVITIPAAFISATVLFSVTYWVLDGFFPGKPRSSK